MSLEVLARSYKFTYTETLSTIRALTKLVFLKCMCLFHSSTWICMIVEKKKCNLSSKTVSDIATINQLLRIFVYVLTTHSLSFRAWLVANRIIFHFIGRNSLWAASTLFLTRCENICTLCLWLSCFMMSMRFGSGRSMTSELGMQAPLPPLPTSGLFALFTLSNPIFHFHWEVWLGTQGPFHWTPASGRTGMSSQTYLLITSNVDVH